MEWRFLCLEALSIHATGSCIMVLWWVIIHYCVTPISLHTNMSLVVPCTSCNSKGSLYSAFGDLPQCQGFFCHSGGWYSTYFPQKSKMCFTDPISCLMFFFVNININFIVACMLVVCSLPVHIKCSLTVTVNYHCTARHRVKVHSLILYFNFVILFLVLKWKQHVRRTDISATPNWKSMTYQLQFLSHVESVP